MEGGLAGDPKLFPLHLCSIRGHHGVWHGVQETSASLHFSQHAMCQASPLRDTQYRLFLSLARRDTFAEWRKEPPISLHCRHNSLPIQQWGSRVAVSVLLPGGPVFGTPGLKDPRSHSGCISRAYSCQRKAAGTWRSFPISAWRPPSTRALPYSGIYLGLSLVHLQCVIIPQQFCLRH